MPDAVSLLLALAPAQIGAYALVMARALGLAATAPAWSSPGLGWRMRIALAAMIALAVAPATGLAATTATGAMDLARMVPIEAGVGVLLGLGASLVIAGARQAGDVVGMQSGLSAASLYDPEAGGDLNAMGHLYGLVALGVFLAMDGPLRLVGCLVESYRAIPAGGLGLSPETADLLFARVGWALSLSVRAAAPVALALVLAGLAMGLLGRAAPSLPLLTLAIPIRAGLGLAFALLGLAGLAAMLASAWSEVGIRPL